MCHDDSSVAPAAPDAGAAASQQEVRLRAADGNEFAGYAARAGTPTGAGVVILPDVRGLHRFYRDLAVRFAEIGLDAVAFDYFGRTAGIGDRTDAFEYMPHVKQTTPEGVAADVSAAIAYLRSPEGGAVSRVYTVGFCFGGGYSWRQSADQPDLAGAIGFYGRPERVEGMVDRLGAPLLLLVAGADANIPVAEVEALARSAPNAEIHVYEGAPHSFFDRRYAEHADACTDAWRRIEAFVAATR